MTNWIDVVYISIPWAAVVSLLIYFIKNPEKAEKWYSLIAGAFSFLGLRLEKSSVARDIQSDINSFTKDYNDKNGISTLPYGVKIEWVSETTRESFVKDGKVVVKMKHHTNRARNFLYGAMDWANKGAIPEGRQFLHKKVLKALDFTLVYKLLTDKKRYDSRQLFLDEIYDKEAPEGSLVNTYSVAFNKLDENGIFMGVVLPEYTSFGKKMGNSIPNKKHFAETIGFATMLEKLSRKASGVDVSPEYKGEHINCSICLVARPDKFALQGLEPYLAYINHCVKEGVESIYVCAIGETNIANARSICNAYEKSKNLSFVSERIQPMGKNRAIVLHFRNLNV
jgi:hypothetical protein